MSEREPFIPFWRLPSVLSFFRERKLQATATILSGFSALFAWKNYQEHQKDNTPRVAIVSISLSNETVPVDNSKSKLIIEYRNIGGSAEGGIKLIILQALDSPSAASWPVVVTGDDGALFLKGDMKGFTF